MKRNESKYKQVVNHVIEGINNGSYKKGDWILSINEFRKNYNLSRDTVFAGLSELKSKGIIDSTPGVGYYIATTRIAQKLNIFLLFNEFNEFKEDLYNSFISSIRKTANVDLYFHNYNRKVFETLINEANYKYTTYILMPGKFTNIAPLLESLSGRVFLLDHFHPELAGKYSSVAQNFEKDTYEALVYGLPHLKKYDHIIMVQKEEKEPIERYNGLCAFCEEYHFTHASAPGTTRFAQRRRGRFRTTRSGKVWYQPVQRTGELSAGAGRRAFSYHRNYRPGKRGARTSGNAETVFIRP